MHMIFISPSYYPHIGGVEYVVKSISERLVEMGHKIAVLAGEPGVNSLHEEIVNGVRVIPGFEVIVGPVDFARRDSVEGPLVSETGLMLALVVALTSLVKYASRRLGGLQRLGVPFHGGFRACNGLDTHLGALRAPNSILPVP
jgi:glycosyltransferase involved in cell wall biosynthesis